MENLNIQAIEKSVTTFVDSAGRMLITSDEQLTAANEKLLAIKKYIKSVDEQLDPARSKAYAAYQEILGLIKKIKSPLEKLEQAIKGEMGRYMSERDRQRREEAARLERERLEKAASLEKAGDQIGADAMLGMAMAAPVEVKAMAPKVDGRMFRKIWKAQVVDIRALCLAIGEGRVPSDAVIPNMPVLNRIAAQAKDRLNIPGVKAVEE